MIEFKYYIVEYKTFFCCWNGNDLSVAREVKGNMEHVTEKEYLILENIK